MKVRPLLAALLLLAIVSGTAHPSRADMLDQSQTMYDYGFWFEQSVERWQEFVPSLPILTRVQLLIDKRGVPGDMVVSIIRGSIWVCPNQKKRKRSSCASASATASRAVSRPWAKRA